MNMRQFLTMAFVGVLSIATVRGQDEGDFWPAVSGAGQLKLSPAGFDPAASFVDLPASAGLLQGWATNEPGFDDVEVSDPDIDTFTFTAGSTIRVRVVALDPALHVWTPGFQNVGVGGSAFLGTTGGDVHTHLFWHIRSDVPEFNAMQTLWRGTFQLIDAGGRYADSPQFLVRFRNVTCLSGDVNGDQLVNNFDIDPFVTTILAPAEATPEQRCAADIDLDGFVTNFDIDPFVALLVGGGS